MSALAGNRFLLRVARVRAFLFRFRTLRLAHRLFGEISGPWVLERSFFGFRLFVDVSRSNGQRLLYLEGERVIAERFLLRRLVLPGARIADVGANIGYYLLFWMAAAGPSAIVHCFEPDPENLVELERNRERNRLDGARIYPVAVGAEDGEGSLAPGINSSLRPDGSGSLIVPLRRLESVLRSPVDVLKIDVEGYEGQVLEGARALLREQRPILFLEVHPRVITPPHSVAAILAELKELYPSVEAFAPLPQPTLWSKLRARYGGPGAVIRVRDLPALLAACEEGTRSEPFWVVCRRRPD